MAYQTHIFDFICMNNALNIKKVADVGLNTRGGESCFNCFMLRRNCIIFAHHIVKTCNTNNRDGIYTKRRTVSRARGCP